MSISRCSPVQFLGNQQPVRRVVLAERELRRCDHATSHSVQTTTKITLHARCRLVSLLSGLGEQLHHDRRRRHSGMSVARSRGGTGCLAIWQCTHSIGSEAVKGRLPVSIS